MFQQQNVGILKLTLGTPSWSVSFNPRFAALAKRLLSDLMGTSRGYGTDTGRYLPL
jgi:hypothetical protein